MDTLHNARGYLKYFPKDPSMRISQGLAVLLFFMDKIKTYKKLNLYGFDFFEKSVEFGMDNEKKYAHSWHIPRSKIGLIHPHATGTEKKFIEKLHQRQLINLYPCPQGNVDKYVLDNLFSKFRPNAIKE
jgi:hypothetical protein